MSPQPKKVTIREPMFSDAEISENEDGQVNQVILSDSEVLPVNTQVVEVNIQKEVRERKRKNKKEVEISKKMKVDVDQEMKKASTSKEDQTHLSLLSLILLIWTKDFLLHTITTLETLICLSLKEKQYEAKRYLHILMDSLQEVQKNLIAQKKELGKCSLKNLVTHLLNSEWCTTYLEQAMTIETSTWITNNYAENFLGQSSSSHITAITSMSSTIAPTPIIPVDVPSPNISPNRSIEDILEESFQVGNSRSSTGLISQSICRKIPGSTSTLTSPGERGYQVVKLDVFDFSKISKKPKTDWWKEANYRSTFIIPSPLDPSHQLVMKLLLAATNQIQKLPGVKREERETK